MIRRSSFEDAIDFSSQVFKIKRKYVVKTAFIVDHEFLSALSLDNETIVNNYAEMKEIKEKTRKSSRKLIALNQEFKKVFIKYLSPIPENHTLNQLIMKSLQHYSQLSHPNLVKSLVA